MAPSPVNSIIEPVLVAPQTKAPPIIPNRAAAQPPGYSSSMLQPNIAHSAPQPVYNTPPIVNNNSISSVAKPEIPIREQFLKHMNITDPFAAKADNVYQMPPSDNFDDFFASRARTQPPPPKPVVATNPFATSVPRPTTLGPFQQNLQTVGANPFQQPQQQLPFYSSVPVQPMMPQPQRIGVNDLPVPLIPSKSATMSSSGSKPRAAINLSDFDPLS